MKLRFGLKNDQQNVQDLKCLDFKVGDYKYKEVTEEDGSQKYEISLGNLRYGQNSDIVIDASWLSDFDQMDVSLSYECNAENYNDAFTIPIEDCDENEILPHKFRYESIDLLKKILYDFQNSRAGGVEQSVKMTQEFYDKWKKLDLDDDFYKGMVQTLER